MDIVRGIFGIIVLVALCWLASANRKAINWRLVIIGLGLQILFAILVIKVDIARNVFDAISSFFVRVLDFSTAGADFVLGAWPDNAVIFTKETDESGNEAINAFEVGYIFAFKVLPTIIFFSALSSLLYYLGILQRVIFGIAWLMKRTMQLSGAEALAAAANIFIGQTEAPLVIKPYLDKMTKSEILTLMTGGMATIAGGVLAAYIGFLGGDSPEERQIFATHLLTASIMSAPAAVVAAKLLYPEVEPDKINKELVIPREKIGSNALDAVTNGTKDGLRLAINVGAMLIVFTAFMFMFNYICEEGIGEWTGLNDVIAEKTDGAYSGLTLQYVLGLIFSPIAWVLGVSPKDMVMVGQLLGEKTILNEFFAYTSLGTLKQSGQLTDPKSIIIATYALCGFANVASIGIQIGGIGAIAPKQQQTLAAFGVRSLIGGTVACFLTATIAGMIT